MFHEILGNKDSHTDTKILRGNISLYTADFLSTHPFPLMGAHNDPNRDFHFPYEVKIRARRSEENVCLGFWSFTFLSLYQIPSISNYIFQLLQK